MSSPCAHYFEQSANPFYGRALGEMKAPELLADNIAALLKRHHQNQHDLAMWCRPLLNSKRGNEDVWLSYVLSGKRGLPLKYLDRIADFWGLQPYQLFQPGIGRFERRRAERRVQKERRMPVPARIAEELSARIDPARPRRAEGGSHESPASSARRALIAKFERDLAALHATEPGGQTPAARRAVAGTRQRRRAPRGPDAEKA